MSILLTTTMVVLLIIVLLGACVCPNLVSASDLAILTPLELRSRGVAPSYVAPGYPSYTLAYQATQPSTQQILHTKNQNVPLQTRNPEVFARMTEQRDPQNSSAQVDDLFRALGLDDSETTDHIGSLRAAERDQNPPEYPLGPGHQYPLGYSPSEQNMASPPGYQATYQNVPVQEDYHNPSSKTISLLKPLALNFVKPFASKVSSKIGGLLSIVLALLGGSGDTSGLFGLKDIVINGIIKPLFLMKGGLKALISKLSIPLISLLLINLEVLITVWWLWEDCGAVHVVAPVPAPVPVYSQPPQIQYPKPVFYNNVLPLNNYNPY